jgi:uncharacterized protein (DUF433 family)
VIEDKMDYLAHFERDPKICAGQWVIKGTRVPVRTLLASLAEGAAFEEILDDFPTVSQEDLRAVIAFAAAAVEDDIPLVKL